MWSTQDSILFQTKSDSPSEDSKQVGKTKKFLQFKKQIEENKTLYEEEVVGGLSVYKLAS